MISTSDSRCAAINVEMKLDGLAIVIPALNEKGTIEGVVRRCLELTQSVVVVDDGSTDGSGELCVAAGAHVVRHDAPLGYDCAISDGLNHAFSLGARAAITCDADGQHRIEDLVWIAQSVLSGEADFAAGIRDRYNRPIEALAGWFSNGLFGTRDPFCGLKCYSRKLFLDFGPFPQDLNIGTLPFVWVKRSGLKSVFFPIQSLPRSDSPRFGALMRANLKLAYAFSLTAWSAVISS